MGAGFIIGGFCPGTSLVALATLKIDGLFFALGALFGIFLFGESVDSFAGFWNSSNMGRFILPELFGVPTGVVVVGVVLMALFMFWGGEHLERIFGGKKMTPSRNFAFGASTLTAVAVMVFFIGQPTVWDRWEQVQPEEEPRLTNREVQIHPGELLGLLEDNTLNTVLLDVRSEADYNLFHLKDATQTDLSDLPGQIPALLNLPASSVVVLMSNDETQATEAWKILVGSSVPNVYLLEGGVNNWLTVFGPPPGQADYALSQSTTLGEDELRYIFTIATGANTPLAQPDPHDYELEFVPKVKIEKPMPVGGGGCG
jgi:rhodanese-related sulfurtransferase